MSAFLTLFWPPAGALHRFRRAALWRLAFVQGCALALLPAVAAAQLGAPAQAGTRAALPAVVVWDFDNQSPRMAKAATAASATGASATSASADAPGSRADFLQRALSESLTATLLRVDGLPVVERQRLKDLLAEQRVSAGDLADEDTRLRLGKIVGASRMVFGGFFVLGDTAQLHVRVVDTATSRVLYSDEAAGPVGLVMQTAEPMNQRLAHALAGAGRDAAPGGRVYPQALWQAYDQALALADAGDLTQAVQALQTLLRTAKDFTPAERQLVALLDKMARR